MSCARSTLAAASASLRRASFTPCRVASGCFHSLADSPRSPNDRQTTVTAVPLAACSAIAPPARQTKSAAWALTTKRSEEHTSELQSLMRISYAVLCLKKKNNHNHTTETH